MNLFDWKAAEDSKREAMHRAEVNADRDWLAEAGMAVSLLALARLEITTDDVWQAMDDAGVVTHEPRAMGPVMKRAAAHGLVRKTDRVRNSVRPECHCRPVAVWESLIYQEVSA